MEPGALFAARFQLERQAGAGGMGVVYRARDLTTGEPVALKVLHAQGVREVDRFVREAEVLAELRHPGIVRYVAHGVTEAQAPWLAMEWLDGEDLADRLTRAGLTLEESVAVVRRASEALAAVHARGIVHRDIKPSNLFLRDGMIERVALLDFGIARLRQASQAMTQTGMLLGTPGYMAPEQARGSRSLDARADVFALGCVLFQCVTGRPPFVGEQIMAVLAKILLEEAPRAREVREDVPEALDALLARTLSKEPSQRPRDAGALAEALGSLGSLDATRRPSATESLPDEALTASEQRLLCAVVAGSSRDSTVNLDLAMAATMELPPGDAEPPDLRAVVEAWGGRMESLADGSTVVVLASQGAATDLAARAARCALAMRAMLPEAPMALAMGRGDVDARLPVGEAIDRATRLLRLATGERARVILVDDASAGLLDARFDLRGSASVRELWGERGVVETSRRLLGKATPCVGRERELGTLEATLSECVEEPVARAVLVTAPAGMGKSRVLQEFLARVRKREEGVEVWAARGDPMSAGSPFGLLARAVRGAAGVVDGEPLSVRQQKLRARVARGVSGADQARVAEFLGELIGAPFPDEGSVQLRAARRDPRLMGDQLRRAWEDWLSAESEVQPVVLVLEDLHWGDLPSLKLVDAALRTLHDRAFLVVALGRPEVHGLFPGLWVERGVQEMRLGELTKRASEKLVRQVLGDRADRDTVERLVARAAGNAFYLEELIRAVAEGKGDALPETVLAMVQARLEGFEPDARRVLRAASVFGEVFWRSGVWTLLGGEQRTTGIREWLTELVEREVIARRGAGRFPGEEEYVFMHGLVREAAYAMLTEHDRVLGHRLAGEWLERAGEREAITLAEHFERGGMPSRAVEWYRRAAEQALEGNDLEAVLTRAERGVACGASGEVLGALRLLQAGAHQWRGEGAEARRRGLEALRWLPRRSADWYHAAADLAASGGVLGSDEWLTSLVGELRELGADGEPTGPQVIALAHTTTQWLRAGLYEEAGAVLEWLGRFEGHAVLGDPSVAARVSAARAFQALVEGDPGSYLAQSEAAAASFEQAGNVRSACLQRVNVGHAYIELGAYPEAERALGEALSAAERMGLHGVASGARNNLGLALARQGRLDEALTVETQALEGYRAQGDAVMEAGSRIYLATLHALAEDLEAAEDEARRAVDALPEGSTLRPHALATLAGVLLAGGDVEGALELASEAAGLLEAPGGVEEGEALVGLVYAEALDAAGHEDAAREVVRVARARLLARAERIRDEGWRESFLGRVPENARTLARAEEWLGDEGEGDAGEDGEG